MITDDPCQAEASDIMKGLDEIDKASKENKVAMPMFVAPAMSLAAMPLI